MNDQFSLFHKIVTFHLNITLPIRKMPIKSEIIHEKLEPRIVEMKNVLYKLLLSRNEEDRFREKYNEVKKEYDHLLNKQKANTSEKK